MYMGTNLIAENDSYTSIQVGQTWIIDTKDNNSLGTVAGVSYDETSNTLTLTNANCGCIDISQRGNDANFNIQLVGSKKWLFINKCGYINQRMC